jgi:subtilisin family serine protease
VKNWRAVSALVAVGLAVVPSAWATGKPITVGYSTPAALQGLHVVFRIDPLRAAEVSGASAAQLRARPGIRWVQPTSARLVAAVPQLILTPAQTNVEDVPEWEFPATHSNLVPKWVTRAAASVTIAVIDTGADLTAPDLAAKSPVTYSVVTGDATVTDAIGHGTFVASIAAGAVSDGTFFSGFGGSAQLMIVQANDETTDFTDANEAAGIVWAVDHGARIINLSLGGLQTSQIEQDALDYATAHGALIVAAAGNEGQAGNLFTYPAAILGSNGLAVGSSTVSGKRAAFSTAANYISIAAPGVNVLGAVSSTSSPSLYPRLKMPATMTGLYGYGSGTSYSTAEVSGAAALVWAANPSLTAAQVVQILERTTSQNGDWNAGLGYGVLNVAAAVASASGQPLLTAAATTPPKKKR